MVSAEFHGVNDGTDIVSIARILCFFSFYIAKMASAVSHERAFQVSTQISRYLENWLLHAATLPPVRLSCLQDQRSPSLPSWLLPLPGFHLSRYQHLVLFTLSGSCSSLAVPCPVGCRAPQQLHSLTLEYMASIAL